jgi:quercetin dioxygenase-like cupin family protein
MSLFAGSGRTLSGEIETSYAQGDSLPWIPFKPLTDKVLLRYYRIDPFRGQILVSARFPPDGGLAPVYHTGPVIAHTIRGAWRYREHDWVSRAGDTVYEAAGSIHSAESAGDEEAVVFLVVAGELLFFDEEGGLVWQESWKTSMERYGEYCGEQGLSQRDLTGLFARQQAQ